MTKSQRKLLRRNALLSVLIASGYVIIIQIIPLYKKRASVGIAVPKNYIIKNMLTENNYANLKKWLVSIITIAFIIFVLLYILSRFTKRK